MARALIAIAAALLVGAVLFWCTDGSMDAAGKPGGRITHERQAPDAALGSGHTRKLDDEVDSTSDESTPRTAVAPPTPADEHAAEPTSATKLRGTFVVIDEHGVEHRAEDGEFETPPVAREHRLAVPSAHDTLCQPEIGPEGWLRLAELGWLRTGGP